MRLAIQIQSAYWIRAVSHDRRSDRVQREVGDGYSRDCCHVREDELLNHRAVLPTPLLGPPHAQPAIGTELADDLLVDGHVAKLSGGGGESGAALGGDEFGKIAPQLVTEAELVCCPSDVHVVKL